MGRRLGFLRCFLRGVVGNVAFLMWCFCGEVMVVCVVVVESRHHVAQRLKTCHEFEVYFRVRCGKAAKAVPFLGMVHQRTQRSRILCPDIGAVLVIVEMVLKKG